MKELSLHILDIVQNSVHAEASEICIDIAESTENDSYEISISDDGCGMTEETLENVLNPFFTTKSKKTGLGIPLFKQHAELTGGSLHINSQLNKGTTVTARFTRSSIDRQPLGDISSTLTSLIRSYPDIEFEYTHLVDDNEFAFSTEEMKEELDGVSLQSPEIIGFISELISGNIDALGAS